MMAAEEMPVGLPGQRTLSEAPIEIAVVSGNEADLRLDAWMKLWRELPPGPLGADPRWLAVLRDGLRHRPYCLEARRADRLEAILPLAYVASTLFGRFLVSLPFVSSCGVLAADERCELPLVDRAVQLADELRVKHLELRLERSVEHAALCPSAASKVLMRRPLPATADALWKEIDSKVRNQVRKGEKQGFEVQWGREELLPHFYRVFSRNMRDLGTPVFPRQLFSSILTHFSPDAEFCVLTLRDQPVAAAMLLHGRGMTKVPCASALKEFSATNANMFMYWQLLKRAVERGQAVFDFGRSTVGSGTERFKAQWDAVASEAVWLTYSRSPGGSDLRKESAKFQFFTQVWRRLPVPVAEWIGPTIVRGIP